MDIQAQVPCKWLTREIQGTLGPSWLLTGPGVNFDETFSPVVKPATVHTVLTLAFLRQCPIHQLDVKDAFLHGTLSFKD